MDSYEVLNYKKINLIGCESRLSWSSNNKLGPGMLFSGDVLMTTPLWRGPPPPTQGKLHVRCFPPDRWICQRVMGKWLGRNYTDRKHGPKCVWWLDVMQGMESTPQRTRMMAANPDWRTEHHKISPLRVT